MPILNFDSIEEAITEANNTNFGLAAYVMTNDLSAAMKMAEGLEFGVIGIENTYCVTDGEPERVGNTPEDIVVV